MGLCAHLRILTPTLLLSCLHAATAAGGENGVSFLYPTTGLAFAYLDTVNVTYTSGFGAPALWTFCRNETDEADIITELIQDVPPYNASALVLLNFTAASPCWFDLRAGPSAQAGQGANSPNWNYTATQRSPTTVGLPAGTASPTGAVSSSGAASAVASPTVTGTASNGLSGGAKAGIGVGIAVGVVGCVAVGVYVWWRRRKAGRVGGDPAVSDKTAQGAQPQEMIQELPAEEVVHELDQGGGVERR